MSLTLVQLPLDQMLAELLPRVEGEPDAHLIDRLFDSVPSHQQGDDLYQPLLEVINDSGILGDYVLIAATSIARKSRPERTKVVGGMYAKDFRGAAINKRFDGSSVELSIECESYPTSDDPFDDHDLTRRPSWNRRKDNLRRFMNHPALVFECQQRTHYYSIIIIGSYARIVRWDRSGAIFSPKFDYERDPAKLGLFLWRFSHSSASVRGHDPTACHVLPGSEHRALMVQWAAHQLPPAADHAREMFAESLVDDWPWYKLTVGDPVTGTPREFLVGRPIFAAPGVVGRGTRGYVALDITNPEYVFVFLKDCWRVLQPGSEQEGSILVYLNEKGVEHIPTALIHGDVEGQRTLSEGICPAPVHERGQQCEFKTKAHYRLAVKEVGLPLKRFRTGKELVRVFLHCLMAHEDAYKKAKVMHRDISVGNIIMVPKIFDGGMVYEGLLTDWELSKRLDQRGLVPGHPHRMGTWQFMSVKAINDPGMHIELADELESMFHAMLWCAVRYLPHNCPNVGEFMNSYFDVAETLAHKVYWCNWAKESAMECGGVNIIGRVPLVFLRERPSRDGTRGRGLSAQQSETTGRLPHLHIG
ncbi:hypothetical protein BV20DRAFT_1053504 [Pilatotrama ljubarskyi]|nr:hypothetical protein BV20DRAFT_1053504 [Pilatotrama ljubarskyi]